MKTILSSTALAILIATGATAGGHMASYVDQAQPTDIFGSEFIGKYIYTAEFEADEAEDLHVDNETLRVADSEREWNNIGEVHDIVLDKDGKVRAVLLDVGGFLGLGEKTVAVSMDDIKFVREKDDEAGEYFLVVNSTKDALMDAPEFDFDMVEAEADMEKVEAETAELAREVETETEEMAADVEAETEKTMNKVEAETAEMASEAEAETEELARDVEHGATKLANEVEAETAEMANEAEAELMETDREMAEVDAEAGNRMASDRMADFEVEGYARVEVDELTTDDLTGTSVYGIDEESVGEISELIVTTDGTIEKAVIDVGGFLGIGEKPVAVSFDQLSVQRATENGGLRVYIDATEEQLEQLPEWED